MTAKTIVLFMFLFSLCNAQVSEKNAYSRDYEFKEGIYLSIEQFKNNAPVIVADILSELPKEQIDFLTQVMDQNVVNYKDSAGIEKKIQPRELWGYSQNRAVYINFNNEF